MNFFSGFYLLFSWTAFFCFSRNAGLTDWRFRFKHKFIIQYSYRLEKKIHCTKQGLKILRMSEFRHNNDEWDKEGVERSGYFYQTNFDSCKLLSDTMLQNTASSASIFSLQEAEFLPLVARGREKKTAENPLPFCTIIFLQSAKCKILL